MPRNNATFPNSYLTFFLLALIMIPAAIYFKSLNNQFISSWDDNVYVTENPIIKSFHGDSIPFSINYYFRNFIGGNYHPLTMLSYSIEYSKFKLNPKPYHITNLVLHLLNTLLVFCFIFLLTRKQWVAFITALLFSIHPMHVESVAWVAERKDVLYSFFYLAALCMYLIYLQQEKRKWLFYAFTFLLFVFAILSKAMAVSLPIAFFVVDYFIGRKISLKTVFEKVPFLLLSVIFGYVAIEAQKSINALHEMAEYNFFDRFLFVCYGLMMYLWKLILPIHLSAFYNYPPKGEGMFPIIFYIAPIVIFGLAYLILKSKAKYFGKDVWFGFGFFITTIALVSQVLPVGGTIISDRYTYLPYIGLFFILAQWIDNLSANKAEKIKPLKIFALSGLVFFIISCCFLTFQRSKVWHDGIRLWSDAIEKFEEHPRSYKMRGEEYFIAKKYEKAVEDYDHALAQYEYPDLYYHRGFANYSIGKNEASIKDFTVAIKYKPIDANAYLNRGNAYYALNKYSEAIIDYTSAISNRKKFSEAYNNRGLAYYYLKKYHDAIKDYTSAIQFNPKFSDAYSNRGTAFYGKGNYEMAIKDYTSAISYRPDFANAYNNRSRAYFNIQKFQLALKDVQKAKELGQTIDPAFMEAVRVKINQRK